MADKFPGNWNRDDYIKSTCYLMILDRESMSGDGTSASEIECMSNFVELITANTNHINLNKIYFSSNSTLTYPFLGSF